jgi:hypothetical protein
MTIGQYRTVIAPNNEVFRDDVWPSHKWNIYTQKGMLIA